MPASYPSPESNRHANSSEIMVMAPNKCNSICNYAIIPDLSIRFHAHIFANIDLFAYIYEFRRPKCGSSSNMQTTTVT